MAQNTPPADDTTKVIGVAYLLANIVWFALSNYGKIIGKVKKTKTDEIKQFARVIEDTTEEKSELRQTIKELEESLVIRGNRIDSLLEEIDDLKAQNLAQSTALDIRSGELQAKETRLKELEIIAAQIDRLKIENSALDANNRLLAKELEDLQKRGDLS